MDGLVGLHVDFCNESAPWQHFDAIGIEQVDLAVGRQRGKLRRAAVRRHELQVVDNQAQLGINAGLDFAEYDRFAVVRQVEQVDWLGAPEQDLLRVTATDQDRLGDVQFDLAELIAGTICKQNGDCAGRRFRPGITRTASARGEHEGCCHGEHRMTNV